MWRRRGQALACTAPRVPGRGNAVVLGIRSLPVAVLFARVRCGWEALYLPTYLPTYPIRDSTSGGASTGASLI
jgi:hypothetical protein